MKNFKSHLLSLVGLLAMLTFISCGEDDEPTAAAPSVSISASVDGSAIASGDEVEVGSTVDFTFTITAPGGVNTLWIGDDAISRAQLNAEAGETSATYSIEAPVDEEGTLALEVYVVDDLNQSSETQTFTIEATSPTAKVQTAIILAAPLGDGSSSTFYSVGENLLYTHNDVIGTSDAVSQNIDLGYYYGASDEATLVSPSEYPSTVFDISAWGTRNETPMFQLVDFSNEDFMALSTVKDVNDVLETLSDETFLTGYSGLDVGMVFAFETAGGIAGIMRVQDLTTGAGASGQIELEMILAEAGE